mgnify:CR=1 FL=1
MKSQFIFLYLAVFITILGFGMVFPLLPFYAQQFGASPSQIGFLAASFSIGQFFAAPIMGRISDRYGRKPVLIGALLGTSIAFILFGMAKSLTWLFISRTLHGICTSGAFPIASAYIGDTTSKEERMKYMARLTAMLSFGFIVGPAAGGLLSEINWSLPFFTASGVAFLNSIFILIFLPESITQKSERLVIKEGFINIKAVLHGFKGEFGTLFFLLSAWAFAISNFQVALPLFAEEKFHYTQFQNSLIFTVTGTVGAVVQWFILPRFSQKFKEISIAASGTLIMALGQFLISISPSARLMIFFASISTMGGSLLRPTINSILSKETKEGQGTTMGLAFSFESLGRVAGPLAAAFLLANFGTQSQFILTSLILVLGFFLILNFLRGNQKSS